MCKNFYSKGALAFLMSPLVVGCQQSDMFASMEGGPSGSKFPVEVPKLQFTGFKLPEFKFPELKVRKSASLFNPHLNKIYNLFPERSRYIETIDQIRNSGWGYSVYNYNLEEEDHFEKPSFKQVSDLKEKLESYLSTNEINESHLNKYIINELTLLEKIICRDQETILVWIERQSLEKSYDLITGNNIQRVVGQGTEIHESKELTIEKGGIDYKKLDDTEAEANKFVLLDIFLGEYYSEQNSARQDNEKMELAINETVKYFLRTFYLHSMLSLNENFDDNLLQDVLEMIDYSA